MLFSQNSLYVTCIVTPHYHPENNFQYNYCKVTTKFLTTYKEFPMGFFPYTKLSGQISAILSIYWAFYENSFSCKISIKIQLSPPLFFVDVYKGAAGLYRLHISICFLGKLIEVALHNPHNKERLLQGERLPLQNLFLTRVALSWLKNSPTTYFIHIYVFVHQVE